MFDVFILIAFVVAPYSAELELKVIDQYDDAKLCSEAAAEYHNATSGDRSIGDQSLLCYRVRLDNKTRVHI